QFATSDPLADLNKLLAKGKYFRDPELPAFTGGLVGFAGYDTVRYYEGEKLSSPPHDDRHLPDLSFGLYNELVIFDHVDKTIKVVANPMTHGQGARAKGRATDLMSEIKGSQLIFDPDEDYHDACRRRDQIVLPLSQAPVST